MGLHMVTLRGNLNTDVAIVALLGFGVWETRKAYIDSAPALPDLRKAKPGGESHSDMLQHCLDADVTVGLVALFAALAGWYLTGSFLPILLIGGTFGVLCYYHHAVLNSRPTEG